MSNVSIHFLTAQCTTLEFTKYSNKHVSGGALQIYTSSADCQTNCQSNPNLCIGFDWTGSQCYFISSYATAITDSTGVDHNRLEAGCANAADDRRK
jgi:hypothetical protein